MNQPRLLAISGKMASGKDMLAREALRIAGYSDLTQLNIASAIRSQLDQALDLARGGNFKELSLSLEKILYTLSAENFKEGEVIVSKLLEIFKDVDNSLTASTRSNASRILLQDYARLYRLSEPDYWVNTHLSKVNQLLKEDRFQQNAVLFSTDIREPNEVIALHNYGFVMVRVLVKQETQISRLFKRDGVKVDHLTLNHPNETALDLLTPELENAFDIKISNDSIITTPALAVANYLGIRWEGR